MSPFESMDFNSQKAAGAVGWPADGPQEARAFESVTSFNAMKAMLSVSVAEDDEGVGKAPDQAFEVQHGGMGSAQAGGGLYRREILPRLRCAVLQNTHMSCPFKSFLLAIWHCLHEIFAYSRLATYMSLPSLDCMTDHSCSHAWE